MDSPPTTAFWITLHVWVRLHTQRLCSICRSSNSNSSMSVLLKAKTLIHAFPSSLAQLDCLMPETATFLVSLDLQRISGRLKSRFRHNDPPFFNIDVARWTLAVNIWLAKTLLLSCDTPYCEAASHTQARQKDTDSEPCRSHVHYPPALWIKEYNSPWAKASLWRNTVPSWCHSIWERDVILQRDAAPAKELPTN